MTKKQQKQPAYYGLVAALVVTTFLSGAASMAQSMADDMHRLLGDINFGSGSSSVCLDLIGCGFTGVSSSSKSARSGGNDEIDSSSSSDSGNDDDDGSSSSAKSESGGDASKSSAGMQSSKSEGGNGHGGSMDDELVRKAREAQMFRGDRGCFDATGVWVTDRTLCAPVSRQAGFIKDRAPAVERSDDGTVTIDLTPQPAGASEIEFYEKMHRRFHGEELRDQQHSLIRAMHAALDHLGEARFAVGGNQEALRRLADVAARIDALRVSVSGDVLSPSEREWAETELKTLLDEGLSVIQDARVASVASGEDHLRQVAAIRAEMAFLIESAPAVFEFVEHYGVAVPDASYIGYVKAKNLLERAERECANAKCPLLAEIVGVMETEIQAPLLQSMQETMEPQEVSALVRQIEDMMQQRRVEHMKQ